MCLNFFLEFQNRQLDFSRGSLRLSEWGGPAPGDTEDVMGDVCVSI